MKIHNLNKTALVSHINLKSIEEAGSKISNPETPESERFFYVDVTLEEFLELREIMRTLMKESNSSRELQIKYWGDEEIKNLTYYFPTVGTLKIMEPNIIEKAAGIAMADVTIKEVNKMTELEELAYSFSNGLLRNENLIREIYTKVSRIKSFPPYLDEKVEATSGGLGIVSDMWGLTNQLQDNNRTLDFILEHLNTLI